MGTPADGEGRIEFLDALRGVAILGILPVNAFVFAYPATLAWEPGWPPGGGAAGAAAVHGVQLLFEAKFITIFSLLFGAGMAVLRAGARERGEAWAPLVLRRLLFLWLVGCLHAVLVWSGDILAYYGLIGLALCWTPGRAPRALKAWGAALLALPLAVLLAALGAAILGGDWLAGALGPSLAAEFPDDRTTGWTPGEWEGFGTQVLGFDPDFEIAVHRGPSLGQAVALRAAHWVIGAAAVVLLWAPRIAGLMLLGMAWVGEGWFLRPGSEEGRRAFGRMLRWGLAVGLPLTAARVLLLAFAPRGPAALLGSEVLQYLGSLGLAGAIAALVARACVARPGARWIRAAAAAGRLAFTNYLLQSVVMTLLFEGTTIFLGLGLGWFGDVGRRPLLGLAAALALAQAAGSVLWLRAFRMGPLEWVWRAATRLRFPPFRRSAAGDNRAP